MPSLIFAAKPTLGLQPHILTNIRLRKKKEALTNTLAY
jgi:hypothetical protein